MLSVLIFIVLVGTIFYLFIETKYYQIKLEKDNKLLKEKKKHNNQDNKKCPKYFTQYHNKCLYNQYEKQFTCQFNPKYRIDGIFYNSPDICCNNRCSELTKILNEVLEKDNDRSKIEGSGITRKQVWCSRNSNSKCVDHHSIDGNCPNDNLTNQVSPAFQDEKMCLEFNQKTLYRDLDKEDCLKASNHVWVEADVATDGVGKEKGRCMYGTGDGPYNATLNASTGYIERGNGNKNPTAIAGQSDPYILQSPPNLAHILN